MLANYLAPFYKDIKSRMICSAVTYGIASLFTQALMMVYLVLVAKWLEADRYGYIAAAYAAALLTSFTFNWGLNEWMIQEGPLNQQKAVLGGRVIVFKLAAGAVWALALWLGAPLFRPDLYLPDILLVVILDVLFDSIFSSLLVLLVLKERVGTASTLLVISRTIRLITGIFLIVAGYRSVFLFSLIRFLCTFSMFLATWVISKPSLRIGSILSIRNQFMKSTAFNISAFIKLINMQIDVNMLSFFGAERVLIANYSVIMGLLNAVITFPSGIYNVILPALIRIYRDAHSRFFRYIRLVYAAFAAMGVIAAIGLVVVGSPLVEFFFGESFNSSSRLIVLLSPMLALMIVNQANITYLISIGQQVKRLLPEMITLVIKLALGLWAVSRWLDVGMVGAATTAEFLLFCGYIVVIFLHRSKPHISVAS